MSDNFDKLVSAATKRKNEEKNKKPNLVMKKPDETNSSSVVEVSESKQIEEVTRQENPEINEEAKNVLPDEVKNNHEENMSDIPPPVSEEVSEEDSSDVATDDNIEEAVPKKSPKPKGRPRQGGNQVNVENKSAENIAKVKVDVKEGVKTINGVDRGLFEIMKVFVNRQLGDNANLTDREIFNMFVYMTTSFFGFVDFSSVNSDVLKNITEYDVDLGDNYQLSVIERLKEVLNGFENIVSKLNVIHKGSQIIEDLILYDIFVSFGDILRRSDPKSARDRDYPFMNEGEFEDFLRVTGPLRKEHFDKIKTKRGQELISHNRS